MPGALSLRDGADAKALVLLRRVPRAVQRLTLKAAVR